MGRLSGVVGPVNFDNVMALRGYVQSQYDELANDSLTHGQALYNIANYAETLTLGDRAEAIREMTVVMIGTDVSRPTSGPFFVDYRNQPHLAGATGFDPRYVDGSIQMIHTVSGLYMTSELGRVGTTMALGREAYTNLVRSWRNGEIVFEGADYELFLATDAVVSILNNPAQLQDFIERHGLQQASLAEVLRVVVLDSSVTPSGDLIPTNREHCFLGDTPIQMWPLDPSIKPRADGSYDEAFVLSKVWEKPISEIKVGDIVVAYDDKGRLGPKRVLRTMENRATHILDFWGTGTTPGHAYHCADGPNKGGHAPIMDILRMDGAIMRADGTMIRAATNCKVGSIGDMMIHASATLQKPDGTWTEPKPGKVRFGTRIILPDDRHISFMEIAASKGWRVSDDGYMVGMMKGEGGTPQEQKFLFPYAYGEELPKPEAYILARVGA